MLRKSIAIISCFIVFACSLYGQNPVLKFRHLSDEQGLSNTTVNKIIQDHLGYMWIGTSDGLNRYDGNRFELFHNEAKKNNSLSNNDITDIYEDHTHQLWIGTNNGLNYFERRNYTFKRFLNDPANLNSISGNVINSVTEDKTGRLWIGTADGGINLLDKNRKTFKHYRHQANQRSLGSDDVKVIYADENGGIWAGTANGLDLYDPKSDSFHSVKEKYPAINLQGISVFDIKSQNGSFWIGCQYEGLYLFNPINSSLLHFSHNENDNGSIGSNLIKDILVDKEGKTWVGCTNGGLNLYNPANRSFYHYEREPENGFSLSQRTVYTIYEDIQHNLWIGSPRGGINLYMPLANKFQLYRQSVAGSGLSYDDVRSFFQDRDQTIWVGTDGGGISLFRQNGTFIRNFRNVPNNKYSLSSNAILNINGDKKGNIWVSTYGGGLNLFNRSTNKFKSFRHEPGNPKSISSDYVTKIFEDSKCNLWVGTTGGLNLFDLKRQEFSELSKASNELTKFKGSDIIDIEEDHNGHVWILSLDSGVIRYDLKTKKISRYWTGNPYNKDLAIGFTDKKNRFWVGKKGLYLYNKKTDRFDLYPDKAGLSGEYIKGVEEDENGNLWLSTSNGITKLNPETSAFTKFNTGDGLQGMEFEVKSCLKAFDGEMYFGGINGFNRFYPKKIKLNNYNAPLYITALEIFNKPVKITDPQSPLKKDISLTDEITLNHNQTSITLSFTVLNYVVHENNKYLYKLDGFDKNWINSGPTNKAVYTNLDPATYVFHVKAANNDGFWSTNERTLKIIVKSPFYATWWFRTLVLLLITFAAYEWIRFKHRLSINVMVEKKNEEMRQVQLQFFTNISHEFRTPLTLITGLLERFRLSNASENLSSYFPALDRNANRLMNLINELMDFNKVASGALRLKVRQVDPVLFLENIVGDFEHLSPTKKLTFIANRANKIDNVWADLKILEKIVLNLLNNSFKYTGENALITVELFTCTDKIELKFENQLIIKNDFRVPAYFFIKVTDNGTGISADAINHLFERYYRVNSSQLGSGVGLAFVKSLTLLHKGDIYVSSEVQKGTEIIIAIPMYKESYSKEELFIEVSNVNSIEFESLAVPTMFNKEVENYSLPDTELNTQTPTELILLVDDNEELRDFYKKSLSGSYLICEAANGKEGFQTAKNKLPDLIISDVMMPVIDGIAFCRAVKNELETSHIPFVMLTAKYGQDSQIEGVESGADIYLSKPVGLKLLQLTIRNILDQRRKIKEFYVKDYYSEAKDISNNAKDKEFVGKLVSVLDAHIINPELDLDFICQEIGMSHSKLYNKVRNITGQSVVEFIRSFRLKKAIQIMTQEDVSMSEVTYRVGIQTQSHFSKAFKKEYGKTPSQFLQEIQNQAHKQVE